MAEENGVEGKRKHSFWYYLCLSHLYNSKGEALFKAAVLSISWVGGFCSTVSATAYYLFSIAIIMEYVVQLVVAKEIAPKLLPITLVLSNLAVFLAATGQLLSGKNETFSFQYVIEIITMFFIWIDAISTVLIEQPDECKIEASLSQCGQTNVSGRN